MASRPTGSGVERKKQQALFEYILRRAVEMYKTDGAAAAGAAPGESRLRLGDLARAQQRCPLEHYFSALEQGHPLAKVQIAYHYYQQGQWVLAACFSLNTPGRGTQIFAGAARQEPRVLRLVYGEPPTSLEEHLLASVAGQRARLAKLHRLYYCLHARPSVWEVLARYTIN